MGRGTSWGSAVVGVACLVGSAAAQPLSTSFTYQGELRDAGLPVTGTYDLRFRLFDAASGGTPVGPLLCVDNVTVTDGRFAVALDFGAQFAGQERFLEIEARADTGLTCGDATGFLVLSPRQTLSATPNALFALTAATATTAHNSSRLNGQPASFYQNAANLTTGTLAGARLSGTYSNALNLNNAGNTISGTFTGSGAGLTGLDAGNLATGTVADARLSANVALLDNAQTFTGAKTFSAAPSFTAAGSPFSVSSTALVTNLNADRLDGLDSTAFLQSIPTPLALTGNSSTHIIRGQNASTVNSASALSGHASGTTGITFGGHFRSDSTTGRGVYGQATAASGVNYGLYGESASTSGIGAYGMAINGGSGITYGGRFESATTSGRGVFGWAIAASGGTYGGRFESDSTSGTGVFGWATASAGGTFGGRFQADSPNGVGVYGVSGILGAGTSYGIYGQTNTSNGVGVFGAAPSTAGGNFGGRFETDSTSGIGVFGWATATTGTTYAGRFQTDSVAGRAVFGQATAETGSNYGVYGQTSSTAGIGVYGQALATTGATHGVYGANSSTSGIGVFGFATAGTGTTYGVFGQSNSISASAYGVWSQGRLGASGAKSFRIDHPEAPADKYLLHYSTESPEVLNAYSGTIVLDGTGQAVVELPPYFARINTSPRYTLTAVGAPMPMLHVAQEIDEAVLRAGAEAGPGEPVPVCSFRIAGGAPGAKVSWRVEAVRHDLWMRRYGAPVEIEKENLEKGVYLHPELYGQPPSRRVQPEEANPIERVRLEPPRAERHNR